MKEICNTAIFISASVYTNLPTRTHKLCKCNRLYKQLNLFIPINPPLPKKPDKTVDVIVYLEINSPTR